MSYRRKITIDHTRVANLDQIDFPVLVSLCDPALKSIAAGGRVSDQGEIWCSLPEGQTRLECEVVAWDSERGALKAWVRLPALSSSQDTEFYLCYGGPVPRPAPDEEGVWDAHYKVVQHLGHAIDPDIELPHGEGMNISTAITVQAWVHSDIDRAEAMQPLISKWEPLSSFDTFSAHDAGHTDGLASRGYFGAVFDGQYVYCCPSRTGSEREAVHGGVLRYNTHRDFRDPASYEAYDASHIDGLHTAGFYGGAFDGRYVYFNPRDDGTVHHSRFLRYDTHRDFKSSAGWEAYDAGLPHSGQGVAFDGRYLYCCPGYTKPADMPFNDAETSGKILRFDTRSGFKDHSSYQVFDAAALSEKATCFDGGAFDGRYIYFAPLSSGLVLQYDTKRDFGALESWRMYDAGPLGMKSNVGAVFDSRYLYFAAYGNSMMVRYDTQGDFGDDASWEARDAGHTSGLDTGGFDGGFFDGRYVYFIPFTRQVPKGENKSQFHGNYLRYDTRGNFDDPESWEAHDAGQIDGLTTTAYNGGATDGRYLYTAPWRGDVDGGQSHGRILRYDTLGKKGSFSLRYCDYGHNGGLNAAVPGPSFIINTTTGPLSVAAHQVLIPGWHHLAGVYSGKSIKLFVDGKLVAERAGSGAIQTNEVDLAIGHISRGAARFRGVIDEVRVSDIARSDDWIKTEYRNLADPTGFSHVGPEEEVEDTV